MGKRRSRASGQFEPPGHRAGLHVVDRQDEAAALDAPLDDRREPARIGGAEFGPAADDLRPWTVRRRRVIAELVLMRGDDALNAGLLEGRPPQVRAGALPDGVVVPVLRRRM